MPDELESALVIALRDTIRWESSLSVANSGTIQPVNPVEDFNELDYQYRDRQLAFRDLIAAAAVVEVAVQVSDVYNYMPDKPKLQGPVRKDLPFAASEITSSGTNASQVRHVRQVSIPWDAARFADADLYGRDSLIYEILARACEQAFLDPPISRIDPTASVFSSAGSIAWSLADGQEIRADINNKLSLNRDLFYLPDTNLTDRDNLVAAYAARVMQVLKNPFEFANRLYVQVTGTDPREPDVYVYSRTEDNKRIFLAEPALALRNRIVYDTLAKTLMWTRESTNEVHPPQIYAMSILGLEPGQFVETLSTIPTRKDAQYWRQKAGQVVPSGDQYSDTDSYLDFTANPDVVTGGIIQIPSASLTVPGIMTFTLPGSLPPGDYRVNALFEPNAHVEIAGAQNTSDTSGTLGGATYEVDIPSGSITDKSYLVSGGDGIIYNGASYFSGDIFDGNSAFPNYNQFGLVESTVNQAAIYFNLALPPGAWAVQMEYTNLAGLSDGFNLRAQYQAQGEDAVDVVSDVITQPFDGTLGQLYTTRASTFIVLDDTNFNFPIFWTGGEGQFHLRKLIFDSDSVSAGSYAVTAGLGLDSSWANVTADADLPQVMSFLHQQAGSIAPVNWTFNWEVKADLPIQVKQVDIQTAGTYEPTAISARFQGWRQECLDRIESVVQQGYQETLKAYGSIYPTFRGSGSVWSEDAMEGWMGFVEVLNPRVRELNNIEVTGLALGRQYEVSTGTVFYGGGTYITGQKFYGVTEAGTIYSGGTVKQVGAFKKSRPGHFGKPALIPRGLYLDVGSVPRSYYDTNLSIPVITSCQPWMIDLGVYVVQEELWMPDNITTPLSSPDVEEVVDPVVLTVVSDGAEFEGEFREGSLELVVYAESSAGSVAVGDGTHFLAIITGTGTDSSAFTTTSWGFGTLFETVVTGTGTDSSAFTTTSWGFGTLFDVIVSGTGTDATASTVFFQSGTVITVVEEAGTITDSAGTFSGGFYAGTYA